MNFETTLCLAVNVAAWLGPLQAQSAITVAAAVTNSRGLITLTSYVDSEGEQPRGRNRTLGKS
ncbi:Hypothetical protein (plasmid) [Pseudomonas putida]|jgi:hypothetical protein|nr:Hypothetical protein [Pseudomonas putida]